MSRRSESGHHPKGPVLLTRNCWPNKVVLTLSQRHTSNNPGSDEHQKAVLSPSCATSSLCYWFSLSSPISAFVLRSRQATWQ